MSKDRFLELLNLYLDDEIDEKEEGELLGAIEANEEFRRIYVEYNLMSQVCSRLPEGFPVARSRMGTVQMVYAFGGMAAALAFVFIGIQNVIPLWSPDDRAVMTSEFAVSDENASGLGFVANDDTGLRGELVAVSFGDSVSVSDINFGQTVASRINEFSDASLSWKNGLVDESIQRESLDHELQLSLDYADEDYVFRKDRLIQGIDSAGLTGFRYKEEQVYPKFSFESFLSPELSSSLKK
tara:strand:- start:246 stop:965 length:720 start_codon:yes stop_codon:yes gene_type:complete